jgi:hypothetical protein
MEEVQKNAINNALVSFSNYNDLESYLRQQWASMMFSFLSQQSENRRVENLLEPLTTMNERIELIAKQILQIVGTKKDAARTEINEKIMKHPFFIGLKRYGFVVSPVSIIENFSLFDLIDSLGISIREDAEYVYLMMKKEKSVTTELTIKKDILNEFRENYEQIRHESLMVLKKHQIEVDDFLKPN